MDQSWLQGEIFSRSRIPIVNFGIGILKAPKSRNPEGKISRKKYRTSGDRDIKTLKKSREQNPVSKIPKVPKSQGPGSGFENLKIPGFGRIFLFLL